MESVKKEFNKWGMEDIFRYPGIDGSVINTQDFYGNSKLKPGEIGILLTHKRIIELAKAEKWESVIIFEDDVEFTDEISKFDTYMKSVPDDWDMLYFGANHDYGKPRERINDKLSKLNFSVALHAFAVKKTMYDKILKMIDEHITQIDVIYGRLQPDCNAYVFEPNMASQAEGFSDIQNKVVNYDRFFKK